LAAMDEWDKVEKVDHPRQELNSKTVDPAPR
jgi:hypothetical protein